MWWSRSGGAVELEVTPSSAQEVGSAQLDPSEFDPAVDTLGAILRDYGSGAFDVEGMDSDTFKEACEAWARHILYAAPVPGEPSTKSDSIKRDWRGVRHFLREHRQRESAYVSRSMGGMQQFVWGFVEELNRSVLGERSASANVSEQLDKMKHAIRANSVDQIKKEVSSAVNIVGKVMEERKQQQERQLALSFDGHPAHPVCRSGCRRYCVAAPHQDTLPSDAPKYIVNCDHPLRLRHRKGRD